MPCMLHSADYTQLRGSYMSALLPTRIIACHKPAIENICSAFCGNLIGKLSGKLQQFRTVLQAVDKALRDAG